MNIKEKEIIEKLLRNAKVRESEVDVKQNPRWNAYFAGQIRILDILLNKLNTLNSGGLEDLSTERPEIFETNGEVAFLNGITKRFNNYDLNK